MKDIFAEAKLILEGNSSERKKRFALRKLFGPDFKNVEQHPPCSLLDVPADANLLKELIELYDRHYIPGTVTFSFRPFYSTYPETLFDMKTAEKMRKVADDYALKAIAIVPERHEAEMNPGMRLPELIYGKPFELLACYRGDKDRRNITIQLDREDSETHQRPFFFKCDCDQLEAIVQIEIEDEDIMLLSAAFQALYSPDVDAPKPIVQGIGLDDLLKQLLPPESQ